MNEDVINFYMFSFHVILLCVKAYTAYFLFRMVTLSATPKEANYMFIFKPLELSLFVFTIIFIIMEAYFLSGFFVNLELIAYESIAMLDEIIMTTSLLYILNKGKHDAKGN